MRSNPFFSIERVLGASITLALGAAATANCGTSGPVECGGCGCGDANSTTTVNIPFETCSDASADDAGAADAGDAGACFATCAEACNASHPGSTCLGTSDGGSVAQCQIVEGCLGRKLEGLTSPSRASSYGEVIARMAWLEAASVRAFERLARELRFHGAPRALVRRARACARDEARHSRIMARIAKRHGARVPAVVLETKSRAIRDLESIARENAIEGCVGETFGAAQAMWRASHASDPDVARAMRSIAPDELRHASLGWAVQAWLDENLDEAARARVKTAKNKAVHHLLQNTRNSASENLLARSLAANLWAA